jgi:O-antigen/teichoic acid export membrane protein
MNIKNIIKNIVLNPSAFFLKNSGIKQTIAKNTFWLAVAEGVTRFLKLFLIIYVARILGATEYGKFTFALAFVSLFAIFSDFGISQITTRELAWEKAKEKEFPNILSLKLVLSIGTLILICLGSFFITPDPIIRGIIWILGIYIIVSSFSEIIYAFLRARQQMEYEAWAKVLQAVVVTGVGFFILFNFPSIQSLSLAYLFAASIALISILAFFHFKICRLKLSFNKNIWQSVLVMSWPLALAGAFGTIHSQTDSVMMGYFGQIIQVGWYNAAYRIIGATLIPVGLLSISFFPLFSKLFKESKEKLQKPWDYYMQLMIFLSVPLMAGGMILAPKIIDFVYDPSYFPSILVFQILLIMAVLSYICNPFSQALIVSNQQKRLFWISLSGAIVNVGLNLILIPKYSLYGAAFTTVVTLFLILFLLYKFTSKFTPIKPFNLKFLFTFLGAGLSSVVMYLVISQQIVYNLNVLFSVLIGALVYLFCFWSFKKLIDLFRNWSTQ